MIRSISTDSFHARSNDSSPHRFFINSSSRIPRFPSSSSFTSPSLASRPPSPSTPVSAKTYGDQVSSFGPRPRQALYQHLRQPGMRSAIRRPPASFLPASAGNTVKNLDRESESQPQSPLRSRDSSLNRSISSALSEGAVDIDVTEAPGEQDSLRPRSKIQVTEDVTSARHDQPIASPSEEASTVSRYTFPAVELGQANADDKSWPTKRSRLSFSHQKEARKDARPQDRSFKTFRSKSMDVSSSRVPEDFTTRDDHLEQSPSRASATSWMASKFKSALNPKTRILSEDSLARKASLPHFSPKLKQTGAHLSAMKKKSIKSLRGSDKKPDLSHISAPQNLERIAHGDVDQAVRKLRERAYSETDTAPLRSSAFLRSSVEYGIAKPSDLLKSDEVSTRLRLKRHSGIPASRKSRQEPPPLPRQRSKSNNEAFGTSATRSVTFDILQEITESGLYKSPGGSNNGVVPVGKLDEVEEDEKDVLVPESPSVASRSPKATSLAMTPLTKSDCFVRKSPMASPAQSSKVSFTEVRGSSSVDSSAQPTGPSAAVNGHSPPRASVVDSVEALRLKELERMEQARRALGLGTEASNSVRVGHYPYSMLNRPYSETEISTSTGLTGDDETYWSLNTGRARAGLQGPRFDTEEVHSFSSISTADTDPVSRKKYSFVAVSPPKAPALLRATGSLREPSKVSSEDVIEISSVEGSADDRTLYFSTDVEADGQQSNSSEGTWSFIPECLAGSSSSVEIPMSSPADLSETYRDAAHSSNSSSRVIITATSCKNYSIDVSFDDLEPTAGDRFRVRWRARVSLPSCCCGNHSREELIEVVEGCSTVSLNGDIGDTTEVTRIQNEEALEDGSLMPPAVLLSPFQMQQVQAQMQAEDAARLAWEYRQPRMRTTSQPGNSKHQTMNTKPAASDGLEAEPPSPLPSPSFIPKPLLLSSLNHSTDRLPQRRHRHGPPSPLTITYIPS